RLNKGQEPSKRRKFSRRIGSQLVKLEKLDGKQERAIVAAHEGHGLCMQHCELRCYSTFQGVHPDNSSENLKMSGNPRTSKETNKADRNVKGGNDRMNTQHPIRMSSRVSQYTRAVRLGRHVLTSFDPLLEGGRARPGQLRLSVGKSTPGTAVYFAHECFDDCFFKCTHCSLKTMKCRKCNRRRIKTNLTREPPEISRLQAKKPLKPRGKTPAQNSRQGSRKCAMVTFYASLTTEVELEGVSVLWRSQNMKLSEVQDEVVTSETLPMSIGISWNRYQIKRELNETSQNT
ncbi:unnamed protein product, partial [Nesidiocoris tenuis]